MSLLQLQAAPGELSPKAVTQSRSAASLVGQGSEQPAPVESVRGRGLELKGLSQSSSCKLSCKRKARRVVRTVITRAAQAHPGVYSHPQESRSEIRGDNIKYYRTGF